jgi:hypothetical protein
VDPAAPRAAAEAQLRQQGRGARQRPGEGGVVEAVPLLVGTQHRRQKEGVGRGAGGQGVEVGIVVHGWFS